MQVFYFTRTGNSEKIALEIAKTKGIKAQKVSDGKDWSGPKNFVLAGAAAAKKEVYVASHDEIIGDSAIIVFPVWAGTIPPVIRGFLQNAKGKKIIGVSVSAVSSIKDADKALFEKVYETKGKVLVAPPELMQN